MKSVEPRLYGKKFVPDCEHEQQNDGSARKG